MNFKKSLTLIAILTVGLISYAQTETTDGAKKNRFKDSLDGKLDFSDFLIDVNGFIPVPQLITEPALGGIGLIFSPVFIKPNKHQAEGEYTPPDITAAFGGYSANKSWGVGGMRIATLPQYKLKYRAALAYADVNLDFYRTLPVVGEKEFGFNFRSTIAFASVLRELGNSDIYLGLEYLYLHNNIKPNFNNINLPDFVEEKDLTSNLSNLGVVLEYDKRDNLFTPNKGWYFTSSYNINANWTGSDYDFQTLDIALYKFFQFTSNWVCGFHAESKLQFGDAPFYAKPAINMRGVPMARYQGDDIYVFETEQRFDITSRWSLVAFGGLAKAPIDGQSFGDADLVHSYGTGFRYLIARKFGIRTGIDFAWSNNDFGWYIIFGSAWNNRS
ncbi:BamA/TamA family outer membrane protein [Tamlana sp. 2_MG-2023]|uniref:BamA/TamA family outer membrane protein n=1 Tax=unclassified Tamlana TaxID=2614803 RepID=UPI0026E452B9|nr:MULTISPECIES: BamA/TamA family outer membrane protein [unclassified Tamlana]MDO6760506.1 BamA/TamA family outer membrane protein [Tamlana sp. 2_MG-2023]MDO6790762.1 BamA/TamA family outer membrane protein [Tamlana sp. 1_MG-2023]